MLSLFWNAVEGIAKQVIGVCLSFAVLIFLTPHDLGIYAIAFSFVLILALVVDDPIGEALIQRPELHHDEWDTGFTANLVIAFAMVLLSIGCSLLVAHLFREPALRLVLPALSCCIVLGSLGNIQRSYLTRELRFAMLARIATLSNLAGGCASLLLAAAGVGYWALVANLVTCNVISSVLYWRASAWKPRFAFHQERFANFRGFAGRSFAFQCVLQLRESALPLLVGWFSGVTAVGYFSVSLRLIRTLGLFFEDMTRRPLFTTISRLHNANGSMDDALLSIITVTGGLAIPAFLGMALVGPSLLPLLFGEQWQSGGPLMPYLCMIIIGWLMLHIAAVTLRASARPGAAVRLLLVPTVIDTLLILVLLRYGLAPALLGMAVRAVAWLPLMLRHAESQLGLSGRRILRNCCLPFLGASLMAVCVVAVSRYAGPGWPGLLLMVSAGCVAYLLTIAVGFVLGERQLYSALRSL